MAIEQVKKAYILAHQQDRESVLEAIQREGLVHLDLPKEAEIALTPSLEEIRLKLSQVQFVLGFLDKLSQKKGFIESLFKERAKATKHDVLTAREIPFSEIYEKCGELENRINRLQERITYIDSLLNSLSPWLKLAVPLEKVNKMREAGSACLVKVKLAQWLLLKETLLEEPLYAFREVHQDKTTLYLLILSHPEKHSELSEILTQYGGEEISFPTEFKATPKKIKIQLEKEKKELEKERAKQLSEGRKFLHLKKELLILKSSLMALEKRTLAEAELTSTQQTFLIEGWVRESQVAKLEQVLGEDAAFHNLRLRTPLPDENPPVVLKNPSWLKPFEVLTELYGLPSYWEIDPTPIMAPFFLLFFGMCLGDVGYGLVLAFFAWLLSKKLLLSRKGQEFMRLLIYGGFAAAAVGFFTGSYFALPSEIIPSFLKSFVFFEPLGNPIIFLVISLVVGFVQLILGLFVEIIDSIKSGKTFDGLLDQGATILFLVGAALSLVVFFQVSSGSPSPAWSSYAYGLLGLGALLIVLFHNRQGKNIFARFFGGIYALYSMNSYLGDTISYARLMALGMATVSIGLAINKILGEFLNNPVLAFLVVPFIFVGGHLINLVISLIGAFVHPLRLQYVEFFKQFYEDGGAKFEPLSLESEHIILD